MMAPGAIRHLFYTPGARAITGAVTQFLNYFFCKRPQSLPGPGRCITTIYFDSSVLHLCAVGHERDHSGAIVHGTDQQRT
jgi:hypothetical protein